MVWGGECYQLHRWTSLHEEELVVILFLFIRQPWQPFDKMNVGLTYEFAVEMPDIWFARIEYSSGEKCKNEQTHAFIIQVFHGSCVVAKAPYSSEHLAREPRQLKGHACFRKKSWRFVWHSKAAVRSCNHEVPKYRQCLKCQTYHSAYACAWKTWLNCSVP